MSRCEFTSIAPALIPILHQVQKYLVNKIDYYNEKYPPRQSSSDNVVDNIFMRNDRSSNAKAVHDEIVSRLNLPFHQTITPVSTINTLK